MAKRTPRSEADDSAATTPARPPRSSTGQSGQQAQTRSRGPRQTGDEATAGAVDDAETFAARPSGDAEPEESALSADRRGGDAATDENGPSEDEIRNRAYQLYLERGGGHGMHFDDWLQAEKELKKR